MEGIEFKEETNDWGVIRIEPHNYESGTSCLLCDEFILGSHSPCICPKCKAFWKELCQIPDLVSKLKEIKI